MSTPKARTVQFLDALLEFFSENSLVFGKLISVRHYIKNIQKSQEKDLPANLNIKEILLVFTQDAFSQEITHIFSSLNSHPTIKWEQFIYHSSPPSYKSPAIFPKLYLP